MEGPHRSAPDRIRALPSWLINQAAVPANRLVNEALSGIGARRPHYSVLAALDELGPASQAELSRQTSIDRSDMVAIINELTEQGFVARTPDSSDRRRNVVTLTPAGRRQLHKIDRVVADVQDELLAPLSISDRRRFVALLTRLVDHHATEAL
jgi:DNA-binding MarR family transcriptional regulator